MLRKSTSRSGLLILRGAIICALFSIALVLGTFSFHSFATPSPVSGTLTPTSGPITYTDGPLVTNETGLLGPPLCTVPNSCSDFTLTVNASAVAATKEILIQGTWTPTQDDFDMFILDASGTIEVAQNASTSNPSAVI